MNAFITGATGFIGSHLLRRISEEYEKIYLLVRKGSLTENIKWIEGKDNIFIVKGDLLEPSTFIDYLSRCEHIYHTAGFVGTNRAHKDLVFKLNYEASVNLLKALEKVKPLKIVYLASIYALGKGEKDKPADETVEYNLEDFARKIPYMKAKRMADGFAFELAEKGMPIVFGFPCYCLGPGDIYLSSSRIVLASIKGLLRFYVDGGINVVDVRDVAEGLFLCMKKGRAGEKYLLGGYNLTFKELFYELYRFTNCRPYFKIPKGAVKFAGYLAELIFGKKSIIDYNSALIMCEYWFYNSDKAKRELGWQVRPLEETLRDSVQWFRINKTYYGRRI
jgi:dihydroflavonol-4-reductase